MCACARVEIYTWARRECGSKKARERARKGESKRTAGQNNEVKKTKREAGLKGGWWGGG